MSYVKDFVFSVEKTSLRHMEHETEQVIQGISTQTSEKLWKSISARLIYILKGKHSIY